MEPNSLTIDSIELRCTAIINYINIESNNLTNHSVNKGLTVRRNLFNYERLLSTMCRMKIFVTILNIACLIINTLGKLELEVQRFNTVIVPFVGSFGSNLVF